MEEIFNMYQKQHKEDTIHKAVVYSATYLWLYAKAPMVCTYNNNWLPGTVYIAYNSSIYNS